MIIGIVSGRNPGTPTPTPTPTATSSIQFVGGKIQRNGAFDFTGLSGGLDTAPSDGDFFLLLGGQARRGSGGGSLSVVPIGTDPVSIMNVQGSDNVDSHLRVWKGLYEAGSATGGTYSIGGSAATGEIAIMVWRGVDPVTPIDAGPTTVSRTNGCDITLVGITPVTEGAVIVCAACSGSQSNSATYVNPPTITDIFKLGRASTYDSSLIVGANYDWVSGEFLPGLFDFSGGDSLSSACAGSIALRPA